MARSSQSPHGMHAPLGLRALLPLALLLGGCPIYLDGSDTDTKALECFADIDCGARQQCVEGICEALPAGTCRAHGDCAADERCAGDICEPLPTGLCSTDGDCADGGLCVQDLCRTPETVCQFNYQCGLSAELEPRVCVDGGCGGICEVDDDCAASGSRCASGQCVPAYGACTLDADCPDDLSCFVGRCLSACATSDDCPLPGDACDVDGRCRPDWSLRPVCTSDDDCQAGSDCVDGVCRVPCPAAPSTCVNIDVQLTHCDATSGYCETELERTPECARSADCPVGESCVNASCRPL